MEVWQWWTAATAWIFLSAVIAALRPTGSIAMSGHQLSLSQVCGLKNSLIFPPQTLLILVGDILIFGSYLAHRSGANISSKDRRAIYATYNCAAEGNLHDQYYSDRQKLWPATHMRQSGQSYEEGRVRYAFGSPMLTVDSTSISA